MSTQPSDICTTANQGNQGQTGSRNHEQSPDGDRSGGGRHGSAGHQGNRDCDHPQQSGRFKGKCKALAGHIYELGAPNSAQDLFMTTMKEIAEYAAWEYTDARDFGSGLVNLTLPTLTLP